nr:uncharacterized mitochondrial protein AtMg00810-like [Tanacetum cinerariifolium]
MGLWYLKNSWFELIAYSDADLAGCNDDYKSTSGGIRFLGDKLVSWSSKKQDYTSMSTTGAEVARQIYLGAEVRMRAEYNIKEKRRLKSVEEEAAEAVRLRDEAQALKERNTYLEKEKSELEIIVTDLVTLVKVREQEVTDLDAVVTSVKLQNDSLADKRLEEFQDAQLKVVNDKLEKLYVDFVDMALHLEEKFYPHLLTTISSHRWLLTHGMELSITRCLHSSEYLSALGAAIGKAIKKEMQDGLAAGITHEDNLVERLGLTESQPCVDQLMVHIHHSPDRVVVVPAPITTALSVTSISSSVISPISIDNYEIAHTGGGEDVVADVEAVADEGADPFPDVSGAKLDVSE